MCSLPPYPSPTAILLFTHAPSLLSILTVHFSLASPILGMVSPLFHLPPLLLLLLRSDDGEENEEEKKAKKGMRVGYYQVNNRQLVRYVFIPKTLLRGGNFNFDDAFYALNLKTPVSSPTFLFPLYSSTTLVLLLSHPQFSTAPPLIIPPVTYLTTPSSLLTSTAPTSRLLLLSSPGLGCRHCSAFFSVVALF